MRRKNPEYMKEIVDFVDRFYVRHRRTPSCREIEAGTSMKRSSIHNYLVAMDEQGKIEYNGQTILTPKIVIYACTGHSGQVNLSCNIFFFGAST